jgi:hypothetical protein
MELIEEKGGFTALLSIQGVCVDEDDARILIVGGFR